MVGSLVYLEQAVVTRTQREPRRPASSTAAPPGPMPPPPAPALHAAASSRLSKPRPPPAQLGPQRLHSAGTGR